MNIFYLDRDIEKNVQSYVDKHVVKMILESGQILCTAIALHNRDVCIHSSPLKGKLISGKTRHRRSLGYDTLAKVYRPELVSPVTKLTYTMPYKPTHWQHPCVLWTSASLKHWMYVLHLMFMLQVEWRYRFNHPEGHMHKTCEAIGSWVKTVRLESFRTHGVWKQTGWTDPPMCMPSWCKREDVVEAYRLYYAQEKKELHKWTRRPVPSWVDSA